MSENNPLWCRNDFNDRVSKIRKSIQYSMKKLDGLKLNVENCDCENCDLENILCALEKSVRQLEQTATILKEDIERYDDTTDL